jgi:hypothetical protein
MADVQKHYVPVANVTDRATWNAPAPRRITEADRPIKQYLREHNSLPAPKPEPVGFVQRFEPRRSANIASLEEKIDFYGREPLSQHESYS